MNQLSSIFVKNLKTLARVGCSAEERNTPQLIAFDIEIETNLAKAAKSEKIVDTICYASVADSVVEITRSRDWILIETLGDAIITNLLETLPQARKVVLSISKFVVASTDAVGIKMQRERS